MAQMRASNKAVPTNATKVIQADVAVNKDATDSKQRRYQTYSATLAESWDRWHQDSARLQQLPQQPKA